MEKEYKRHEKRVNNTKFFINNTKKGVKTLYLPLYMGENVYFCIHMKEIITILTILAVLVSCQGGGRALDKTTKVNGDSIAYQTAMLRQQDYSLSIIDSLEQKGMLTAIRANFWRGYSCDMCWNTRQALYFYQKSFDAYTDSISDWNHYLDTGYRLAYMHYNLQEYGEAMRLVTMLIDKGSKAGELRETEHAFFIELIIMCQLKLGQTDEVKQNALRAYKMLTKDASTENQMLFTYGRADDFLHAGDLDEAEVWLKRCVDALHHFESEANDSINLSLAMEYHGHTSLLKASILLARGQRAESFAVYDAIPQSQFYHPSNIAEAAEYLMAAERYDEALVFLAQQDSMGITTTECPLDIIHEHMIPHFKAFLKAGHTDEALEVAMKLQEFRPLRAVHGNIDGGDLRRLYPEKLRWDCEGADVLMTHIGGYPGKYDPRIRNILYTNPPKLFISGHSHILKVQFDKTLGVLHINPGAAGLQGWQKVRTLIRFSVHEGSFSDLEVIEIPR